MTRMALGAAAVAAGAALCAAPAASSAATITVTSPASSGPATLAAAIDAANASPTPDTIAFAIAPGGAQTIALPVAGGLPTVTAPVAIDGRTQGGLGYTGPPLVKLTGPATGTDAPGLRFAPGAAGASVRGLVVARFNEGGIVVDAANTVVAGNYVGVDFGGVGPGVGNAKGGVVVNASGVVVGGTAAADGNVIGDNHDRCGVDVTTGGGSVVEGNRIGSDAAGLGGLGNEQTCGVRVGGDATDTTIGGLAAGAANVVSGNQANGIEIAGGDGTKVQGNRVGVGADGATVVANIGAGVLVSAGTHTVIGGTASPPGTAPGNVIAGNTGAGVEIAGALARDVVIAGNLIGMGADGSSRGNADGVALEQTGGGNLVGGATAGAANVISGNTRAGVRLSGGADAVQGNSIGVAADGRMPVSNHDGVVVTGPDASVGGVGPGARNLISGNAGTGVTLTDGAVHAAVLGNQIGGDRDGGPLAANAGAQVRVTGAASANAVGGPQAGAGNDVIEVNPASGAIRVDSVGVGNSIRGNRVRLNASPTAIDVGPLGVTPAVTPQFTSVLQSGPRMQLLGTLNGAPLTTYALDVYAGAACGATHRQPDRYLDAVDVATDAAGLATINVPVDGGTAAGESLLATATDPVGTTNELGPCAPPPGPAPTLELSSASYDARESAGVLRVTVVRHGGGDGSAGLHLRTVDGTARAGVDYTAVDRYVVVNADESAATVDIPIGDDGERGRNRTFSVVGVDPNAAVLGPRDRAAATIEDDTAPPVSGVASTSVEPATESGPAPQGDAPLVAAAARPLAIRIAKPGARVERSRLTAVSGVASGDGLVRVEVAVAAAGGCKRLFGDGRLHAAARNRPACARRWLTATGTSRWKLKLGRSLPPGRYVIQARAVSSAGRHSAVSKQAVRVLR